MRGDRIQIPLKTGHHRNYVPYCVYRRSCFENDFSEHIFLFFFFFGGGGVLDYYTLIFSIFRDGL